MAEAISGSSLARRRREPLTASNPPHEPRIRYRSDDYSSLRHKLLCQLEDAALFPGFNRELRHARGPRDLGVTLVELFAYLGDVLGFYQDCRANEAFLGTAALRESLLELCALIDHPVAPGASAAALQVFLLKEGARGVIPAGFKLRSRAAGGAPAQVFETQRALAADAARNRLRLAGFDRSGRRLDLRRARGARLDAAYTGLAAGSFLVLRAPGHPDVAVQLLSTELDGEQTRVRFGPPALAGRAAGERAIGDLELLARPAQAMRPAARERADEITAGQTRLDVTPPVPVTRLGQPLLLESEGLLLTARAIARDGSGRLDLNRPFALSLRRSTTRIHFGERIGTLAGGLRPGSTRLQLQRVHGDPEPEPGDQILLSDAAGVERGVTAAFDHGTVYLAEPLPRAFFRPRTGRGFGSIEVYRVGLAAGHGGAVHEVQPLRLRASASSLVLDKTYDGLEPGAALVLHDGEVPPVAAQVAQVAIDAEKRSVLRLAGPLGAAFRADALSVYGPFAIRAHVDGYDRAEASLAAGATRLRLDGAVAGLAAGDALVIEGGGRAEGARIAALSYDGGGHTAVDLEEPLEHAYPLGETVVFGNVVPVTHGETVADEVLGSGDSSAAGQRFALARHPVTYVPDASGARGVRSSLEVFVDAERWEAVESLAESGPDDRHYAVEVDADDRVHVVFGDGRHGARPTTGRDNVRARYRVGLGASGNVPADTIALTPDPLAILEATRNPLAASGGADRDGEAEIRRLAPLTVRTLDRAVTLEDYAELALAYAGIAKARADWAREDGRLVVLLTVASHDGGALAATQRAALRAYLDARRSPHHRLHVRDYRPLPVRLSLDVRVQDGHLRLETQVRVQRALGAELDEQGEPGFFHFARRALGEDLHVSDVYRAVERVRGVGYAVARAFHPEGEAAAPVRERIRVPAGAVARGGHATDPRRGILDVHATGGIT